MNNEVIGLFALGLFFRPATALLFINMGVAVLFHFSKGATIQVASHEIELVILFFSMFFIGPGKLSLDEIFSKK